MSSSAPERSPGAGQVTGVDGRRRLIAESLRVGNPANNARDLAQTDSQHEHQIELDVDGIRPYEHNPRRTQNPKFAEIKESIRASGIRNPITVTRRPGEAHFIVEAGGNTRLLAIQQLWQETRDVRFRRLVVLFRPWCTESHVLIAHLIENEQRGDMTFWDKANGVAALKGQWEAEQGRMLSVRQLEAELQRAGISISYPTLSYYRFATERLRSLGEAVTDLSGLDVTKIQPRLNLMKRYAQSRASVTEDDLYAQILEPVFRGHVAAYPETGSFSAAVLCRDCEDALAVYLDEPVSQCRKALAALARPATVVVTVSQDAASTSAAGSDEATSAVSGAAADEKAAVKTFNTVKSLNSVETPVAAITAANASAPGVNVVNAERRHASGTQPLIDQMQRFAHHAGLGHCLRAAEAAPLGLVMEGALSAVDGGLPSPLQSRAWWLLALLCGYFDHDLRIEISRNAPEPDIGIAINGATDTRAPCCALVIDVPFLLWLFDAQDEVAQAFRQIVALLGEFPRSLPTYRVLTTYATSGPEAV